MKIGIDIGTVHSKVCFKDNTGKIVQINTLSSSELGMHSYLLPSVVGAIDDELIVGFDALAKVDDMDIFINDLKRDISKKVPYAVNNSKFTVEDGYEAMFSYLINCAERATDMQIDSACITHPAIFDDENRQLLVKAATRAGVLSIDLIAEPIAAVISYCNKEQLDKDGTFLVYDLGGTFDATIVKRKNGRYIQLGEIGHIEQCGGRIFDNLLFQLTMTKLGAATGKLPEAQMQKLKADVGKLSTKVKHQLSQQKEVTHKLLINGNWHTLSIQREEFNGAIVKLIDTTFNRVRELTGKLHISDEDIDAVIATGGSCNIPLVKDRLQKLWPDKVNVMTGSHVIAQGALLAMQGTGEQTHHTNEKDISAKCSKCGSSSVGAYYCRKCGWVAQYPDYIKDDDMKPSYQANVQRFVNDLKSIEQIKLSRLAEASISRYANVINRAKLIAKNNNWIPNETVKSADEFLEQCTSGEFHVAIIGTIKAGKSTLINALLQRELASTNVTPETAALTKFRRADKSDYIKITFFTKSEWQELWDNVKYSRATIFKKKYEELNARHLEDELVGREDLILDKFEDNTKFSDTITSWTSAKKPNHYFVKEIEIGLKDLNIPKEIILVDTPGLDDPVTQRSDITKKYMTRANMVLVCVKVDKLTGYETETIMNVFANLRYAPQKVFVLATQIDGLQRIQKDWANIKDNWMPYLSGPNCYNDPILAEKNLVPIAAYLDTLLTKFERNENLDNYMEEDTFLQSKLVLITKKVDLDELKHPEIMAKMRDVANMSALRKRLMNEEVENAQYLMYQNIAEKYKNLKTDILEPISEVRKLQNDKIVSVNSGIEHILKVIEDAVVVLEENRKRKEELDNAIKGFSNQLDKKVGALIKEIKNVYKN